MASVTLRAGTFLVITLRGIHAKTLKERVVAVETPEAGRVRFRLKQPSGR